MTFINKLLSAVVIVCFSFFPSLAHAKHKTKHFEHNIQLQLSDGWGVPVPGTQFWVKLKILKEGEKVTIQLPLINFVTGPFANAPFEPPPELFPPLPGGYLYTSAGFLPPHIRPNDIVNRSWLVASNNGASLPFSFTQDPSTLPVPPTGYILQVTNAGALVIQCPGTFGNIIPVGPQILLPTDISYLVKPRVKLKRNTVISTGPTNTTQFTNPDALEVGLRDTHVNDAFEGVAAWAWSDNSTVVDKTNGTTNVMVAVGKVKDGKLKVRRPVQLTDLPPETGIFDTAVAINRTNKNNLVVSYGVGDFTTGIATMYRAVSFDGGKTWPDNGPTNIQPSGPAGLGDYRGVSSDRYGNIWISSTNILSDSFTLINQPFFLVSTDGGVTFQLVYTLPLPATNVFYDFPQFCFGGDGQGNYGLHFVMDYINEVTGDSNPIIGFIPINGPGQFGTPMDVSLLSFENNINTAGITASLDGRVWTYGSPSGEGPTFLPNYGSAITSVRMVFKSPGPLDKNYAGPWDFDILNLLNEFFLAPIEDSQPIFGYFLSPQSNFFDDKRQALYNIIAAPNPDFSQNMRLNFAISRDNGQTWSNAIVLSNTDFANRGFTSMALDTARGDLYFGWYDGRNDPTFQSVEYFGAVIPAKNLNKLVNKIPLSNPLYTLPPATTPPSFTATNPLLQEKSKEAIKKRIQKKFGQRLKKVKS